MHDSVNYDEARIRLTSHANLPGTGLPESESLVWSLWNAEHSGIFPNIPWLTDDVMTCLKVVNNEMNGVVPSQRVTANRNDNVVVETTYSMSRILVAALQYHRAWSRTGKFQRKGWNALEDCINRVAYAWDQVLAGDLDDVLDGYDIAFAI